MPSEGGISLLASVLQVKDLSVSFYTSEGLLRAVNHVSWNLRERETLGIVGESGCGKSVTALSILRLIPDPPGRILGGEILFEGTDLLKLPLHQMEKIRGDKISMVFQDPTNSLDPVFTVGDQISEVFQFHQGMSKREAFEQSIEMLRRVRIPSPEKRVFEYPYQLSGGMQQRIMIAMALACRPKVLIADEPTTALDVTIQAQILDLMLRLKEELDMAIVLITHDLGIIAEVAQRVIVMYAGEIVEETTADEIFENPMHPYTRGLLRSIPRVDERGKRLSRLQEIPGVVPSFHEMPKGCLFYPRCPEAIDLCGEVAPEKKQWSDDRSVRCWHYLK